MWERFTERSRKTLYRAQAEAQQRGSRFLLPEHLLLALLREEDTLAVLALKRSGIAPADLRVQVERCVEAQEENGASCLARMEIAPRTKRVIDLAFNEARKLDNRYIGTEHLLLGLLRERESLAGRLLTKAGLQMEATRATVSSLLEQAPAEEVSPAAAPAGGGDAFAPFDEPPYVWRGYTTSRPVLTIQKAIGTVLQARQRRTPGLSSAFLGIVSGLFGFLGMCACVMAIVKAEGGIFFSAIVMFALSYCIHQCMLSTPEIQAAQELVRCDEKRALSALIEITRWQDRGLRAQAWQTLSRLLPQIRANEGAYLTTEDHEYLYAHLTFSNGRRRPEVVLSILKALEQVGTEKALPFVERLADGGARTDKEREIIAAAQNCLPYLTTRVQYQRANRTLLRPAAAGDGPVETLLRPAAPHTDADSGALLRPHAPVPEGEPDV